MTDGGQPFEQGGPEGPAAPPPQPAPTAPAPPPPAPVWAAPAAPDPWAPPPQQTPPQQAPQPPPAYLGAYGQGVDPGAGAPPPLPMWPAAPPAPETGPLRQGAPVRRRGALAAAIIGACLVSGAVGGVAGSAITAQGGLTGGARPVSLPPEPASDRQRTTEGVSKVAAAVLPSVVAIQVRSAEQAGTGSGFVIDSAGHILTNNHVVEAAAGRDGRIQVLFSDGRQARADVVGTDASYDLAVVKVRSPGVPPLQLANSDEVLVGDSVIAIGAPLGLQGTVTTGIVSAKNRPVSAGDGDQPAYINAIQTDAAINPGNSGGPLVDVQGRVIGVNSAIARVPGLVASGGSIGLGFAIPSSQARRTAEQLIRTGKAVHPIIGVALDSRYEGEGVRVADRGQDGAPAVTPGGPAAQAGIEPGDVITEIDGRPVVQPDELIVAIRSRTPGETVKLTVRRGSSEREVAVRLDASED